MTVGLTILAVYVIGYIACWRTCCWWLASSDGTRPSGLDGFEIAMSIFLGSLITIFWPPIALGLLVAWIYRARDESIVQLIIPRHEKRRFKLEEQAQRIRELERELGIN